jgi:hypothetical protein
MLYLYERSQTTKEVHCVGVHLYTTLENSNPIVEKSGRMLAWKWGVGTEGRGRDYKEFYKETFGAMDIFFFPHGTGVTPEAC